MDIIENKAVRDLAFDVYTERQLNELTPGRVAERAKAIKVANNFYRREDQWLANEYIGFGVVSMVDSNPSNELLTSELGRIQQQLIEGVDVANAFYLLPSSSFHQTVANVLSNERYKKQIIIKGLEFDYPFIVDRAFKSIPPGIPTTPIRMKMIGLSVFSNALGVLGIFENEEDYQRVLNFRKHFYSYPALTDLDVRMTRPFIGHITLAYLEKELNEAEKEKLMRVVNNVNLEFGEKKCYFSLSFTELRRFDDLSDFKTESHFPSILL